MQAHPVFRTLNRPLTILGAERKLFFFALVVAACVFNLQQLGLGLAQYGNQHRMYPYDPPNCPKATAGIS